MILAGELCRSGRVAPGWIEIRGERVEDLGWGAAPRRPQQRFEGILARGLVDLQVNGTGGDDVAGGGGALHRIAEAQLDRGVTSLLPTLITTDEATAAAAMNDIQQHAADPSSPIAGAHLEGPFLNPQRAGVHRPELLKLPTGGIPGYYENPAVRLVTLAPELEGALELCSDLSKRGVTVSLGHTAATGSVAEEAVRSGARMVTHLFNAMPQFHHRDPGVAGWALIRPRLGLGLIPDGHHVQPPALELVRRAAGSRVVLVTDASVAADAPAGSYQQAGRTVERLSDGSVIEPGGGPAGSGITLDEGLRRWVEFTSAGPGAALRAAGPRAARMVGLPAELTPGAPADIVLLGQDLQVQRVMKQGRWVRPRP